MDSPKQIKIIEQQPSNLMSWIFRAAIIGSLVGLPLLDKLGF